ncbi:hypothetical protein PBRA_006686 [Plasmodiophora brassicae]|nr:hypothetical protein PBRA_006686 [Plasmodiophora brassicae]
MMPYDTSRTPPRSPQDPPPSAFVRPMGIPLLSKWCYEAASGHMRPVQNVHRVATLAIDLNEVLHRAVLQSNGSEARFHRRAISMIRRIVTTVRPSAQLGIFMDGVAPSAKYLLQIKRRRASPPSDLEPAPSFSSLALTPGTPALCTLAANIRKSFGSRTYLSCSEEPGEGEVKLIGWIKRLGVKAGRSLLFGSDADLLAIGCAQACLHEARVCNHDMLTLPVRALRHLAASSQQPVHLPSLAIHIYLLGNDYMPKVSGMTPQLCFSTYKSANCPYLVVHQTDGSVDLRVPELTRLFEHLVEVIPSGAPTGEDRAAADDALSDEALESYFKGLAWLATMYHSGQCPDNGFVSTVTRAVRPEECLRWLQRQTSKFITCHRSSMPPHDVDLAQMLLMPAWGRSMVQPHLRRAMDPDSEIAFWFQTPCAVCKEYRQYMRWFEGESPEAVGDKRALWRLRRSLCEQYEAHKSDQHALLKSPPVEQISAYLRRLRSQR